MTWALVIVMHVSGYYGLSSQSVVGFPSREACMSQLEFVRKRDSTYDAYCLNVRSTP